MSNAIAPTIMRKLFHIGSEWGHTLDELTVELARDGHNPLVVEQCIAALRAAQVIEHEIRHSRIYLKLSPAMRALIQRPGE